MYRLLALDLDGTLLNNRKQITPRTYDTLMQAQQKGLRIAITSGRPLPGIRDIAHELRLSEHGGFMIGYNGGLILDCSNDKILYSKQLSPSVYPLLYQYSLPQDFTILCYTSTHVVSEDTSNEYVQYVSRANKMPVKQVASFLEEIKTPQSKFLIVGEGEKLALLEQQMKEELEGQLSVYRSEPFLLELLPLGIDKANGLQHLIGHMGIKREEVMACGDGFNDLSMIQFAGMGVAMQNAQAIVRQSADYITRSNEEDGVAVAVERFFLKENC